MYEIALFGVVLSAVVGGAVTLWLLARHDRQSPAAAFGVFMLVMTYWSVTHLGTLLTETLQWQLAFTQLSYVASTTAPVVWLVFAVRYTGRDGWLSPRRLALVSVVPAVTVALMFTTQHHAFVYTDMWLAPRMGHPVLQVEYGPWFPFAILYFYVLLLAGTGLLFAAALSDNRLYRRQSAVLVGAITVPWLVNVAYVAGFRPIPWVDPTPAAFVAAGIPLAAVVVRTDLASHLPVAHERVFRTLEEPILVVAPDGIVIDANRAARTILGDGTPPDGMDAETVLPPDVHALVGGDPDGGDTSAGRTTECTLQHGGETRTYVARRRDIAPDSDGVSRGVLLRLTDITVQERQRARLEDRTERLETQTERLERKNEQLERLADIVSHDLQAPLSTAGKVLTLLERDLDDPDPQVERAVADLDAVHDRLRGFAEHLPRLARESTDVETTERCDLRAAAEAAWNVVDTPDVDLDVESTRTLEADPRRLGQVFENLFRNAVEHGRPAARAGTGSDPSADGGDERRDGVSNATTRTMAASTVVTTIRVGVNDGGFYLEDDGPGIPRSLRDEVFEYGVSSGEGSGFGLAIVRTIVEAHGWSVDVGASRDGGARFEVRTSRDPPDADVRR